MRALLIVHQADSGAGVFLDGLRDLAVELDYWYPAQGQTPPESPRSYDAVLSFGGAVHPVQDAKHPWLTLEKRFLATALGDGVPLFGVCLGAQLIAEAAGTRTRRAPQPEIGWAEVELTPEAADDPVFRELPPRFEALEWHSYEIPEPAGALLLARSNRCLQGFRIGDCAWGIQFHAEVSTTDFHRWLELYDTDPDAVAAGLDTASFRAQADLRFEAWHALGRGLCRRFLNAAGIIAGDVLAAG